MAAIRKGGIDLQKLVNLSMMDRLAIRARNRHMVAPEPGAMAALVTPLAEATVTQQKVDLDEEAILAGEAWLRALRDQLGRSSVANLTSLINDLIAIADIKTALTQSPRSPAPAPGNSTDG